MATRKRVRTNRSYDGFDSEVGKEIEKQAQEKQEIESRRRKRKLIFWTIVIFGVTAVAAISIVFSLLLGLVEW